MKATLAISMNYDDFVWNYFKQDESNPDSDTFVQCTHLPSGTTYTSREPNEPLNMNKRLAYEGIQWLEEFKEWRKEQEQNGINILKEQNYDVGN